MPSDKAKEQFQNAVDQTRNSVGDSKGPPGGQLKVAHPSKDSADISNKFVNPGRTAQPHADTVDAENKTAGGTLSFFKSGAT